MRFAKKLLKWIGYILLIPISYLIVSLILTSITIDRASEPIRPEKTIYLNTNGIHLDIIVTIDQADNTLLSGINYLPGENYLAFGWGDENFYLNTPTWGDLTLKNAFTATFMKSPTLVHVTRYSAVQSDWIEIPVSQIEFNELSNYLSATFQKAENGEKIKLEEAGYTSVDDFYRAHGSYSFLKTCNSWVNSGFRESGLKSCLWTPFDFGLMNKYK